MGLPVKKQIEISAAAFKATCREVLRGLESRAFERVIITRRGKRIAEFTPPRTSIPKLWGSLRGSITVAPGVDLTEPTRPEPLEAKLGQ